MGYISFNSSFRMRISPEARVADPSACDRLYATGATADPEIINKQDPNANNVAMLNFL
jgi:hypothetical protein